MEKEKNNKEKVPNDYYPATPDYDPTYKQDPLPYCGCKEKQALDPNYYPSNYVSEEEDAQLFVDNLIVPLVNDIKDEDQEEEEKGEKNNGEKTNREEEDRREGAEKTQANSGQEADEEENNYLEY